MPTSSRFVVSLVLVAACSSQPSHPDVVTGSDAADDLADASDALDPCDPSLQPDALSLPTSWDADLSGPLPNLSPVISDVQVQSRTFDTASCEVQEGCTMPGGRRLLRFSLSTPNTGAADLRLGSPTAPGAPTDRFTYSACHGHYHFNGYANYQLLDGAGNIVATGHKQSFCLEDTFISDPRAPHVCPGQYFTCANQGVHIGWMDIYPRVLDCQYVDITDVAPGSYQLRVSVNPERILAESDYDDNVVNLAVTVPPVGMDPDAGVADPTSACAADTSGPTRDCGWVANSTRTCTPGAQVTVACNPTCTPAVGTACMGDPMIRTCPDEALSCTHAVALAESDDACGTLCPSATFRCPDNGRFYVLTGPKNSGMGFECQLAVQ